MKRASERIFKTINIWQRYGQQFGGTFFGVYV